jgi:hypothetical protein
LRHCRFEGGTLRLTNVRALIEDTTFAQRSGAAVFSSGSDLEVRRSQFLDVAAALQSVGSTLRMADCTLRGAPGGGTLVSLDGAGAGRSRIERCAFLGGPEDGVRIGAAGGPALPVDLRDSTLRGFAGNGIFLDAAGTLGLSSLLGCVVADCGAGLRLGPAARFEAAHHNTIYGCFTGLALEAPADPPGAHGELHSLILWANREDVQAEAETVATIAFSDFGGAPWPGEGNFQLDPRFADAGRGDFALAPDSPCRGAGKNGTDMGAVASETVEDRRFVRADVDGDGVPNVNDAIAVLFYVFINAQGQSCLDRLDVDDDGALGINDPIYLLVWKFVGGEPIPPPFPNEGIDPTPDALACR